MVPVWRRKNLPKSAGSEKPRRWAMVATGSSVWASRRWAWRATRASMTCLTGLPVAAWQARVRVLTV
ncbi:hypothetical protein BEK98_25465 [Streptomyces diastatochromogenes]|uniref:Uncharacterized protein n=1 Tax=Streptomyces diastatochromogenes TaxID=42236 RepID=A0A233SB10_STRDA|nr:hypothetical protein BEK98_25465 [Streptomyces diastatochromogenes]